MVNDVQNATELVVVQSTMRKRFSLSWDNDPDYEMNAKWAESAQQRRTPGCEPFSALDGTLARLSPGETQMYNITISVRER